LGQMLSDLGGAASVALVRIGDCRRQYPTVVSVGEATPRADVPVQAIWQPGSTYRCLSRHEWSQCRRLSGLAR
jgi:hypothetical protein